MMQGVITSGTAQSMGNYKVKSSAIAGKTGTTNDNSDLWFMGYTPQLLAGAWVGCDDRFLRFTDNYFGQGARGALPIWGYFMEKVTNDPACNLDQNANFERPANLNGDFNVQFMAKDSLIMDNLPAIETTEDIGAESDYQINKTPPVSNTNPIKSPAKEPNKSTKDLKKENKVPVKDTKDKKVNKEATKPKALMLPNKNKK
jgi:penicillin-binding protein 1A